MKKTYSILLMLAVIVAAVCFTSCHKDDEEDENGRKKNPINTITLIDASGKPYYSIEAFNQYRDGDHNGYLCKNIGDRKYHIECAMKLDDNSTSSITYLTINLENGETKISDFPVGHDLGRCYIQWRRAGYAHSSGSVVVTSNTGGTFTLLFHNYTAISSSNNQSVVINGTLLVENQKTY